MVRPTSRPTAKSEILNIRVTPELKQALQMRAAESYRKLSDECEMRLFHSLGYDYAVVMKPRED